jgi:hypothetical protein
MTARTAHTLAVIASYGLVFGIAAIPVFVYTCNVFNISFR